MDFLKDLPYNGDMNAPTCFEALNEDRIAELMKENYSMSNDPFVVEMAAGDKPALLIRQNGNYLLRRSGGNHKSFRVSSLPGEIKLAGPWEVDFPRDQGSSYPFQNYLPCIFTLRRESNIFRDRHYKRFHVRKGQFGCRRHWLLNLGRVEVIAGVKLNGRISVIYGSDHIELT
jgi:hypothetical protein